MYKWAISRKEAREARYWIRLLYTASADSPEAHALEQETTEFIRILSTLINKGKAALAKDGTV